MKKKLSTLIILLSLIISNTYAESLSGQVLNDKGVFIPGMEIKLYHPAIGESKPRYTNKKGKFYFYNVPKLKGVYNVEYYWRGKLVHRASVSILGKTKLPPLHL